VEALHAVATGAIMTITTITDARLIVKVAVIAVVAAPTAAGLAALLDVAVVVIEWVSESSDIYTFSSAYASLPC
jgi:uncharacterized protein (UPF0254 family)